ncbi:hypothetical protein Ciccas_000982 [Cichlidogyrus casuarinus]|uniref:DUF4704 domain-containing protein n=1 Tax=Cichlidogyrus casuarinus TaxID=1844966 RepID=A0ABD2QLE5_9PLAT
MTKSGLGYTGHFLGESLIITAIRSKGKGYQHCIQFSFVPDKWYMISIVFVYSRWGRNEIQCFVDGNIVSQADVVWSVEMSEPFDHCVIGGSSELAPHTLLCGCISNLMTVMEALTPLQVSALFRLGFNYKGYFKFESEAFCPGSILTGQQRASLYESNASLSTRVLFSYSAATCDDRLCLNQCLNKGSSSSSFASHAFLRGETKVIKRQSIMTALENAGGVCNFFPLFTKIGLPLPKTLAKAPEVAVLLLGAVFNSIRRSHLARRHFVHSDGLLIFADALRKGEAKHASMDLLHFLMAEAEFWALVLKGRFPGEPISSIVAHLDRIIDLLLLDASIWIRSPFEVQAELYKYLSSAFLEINVLRGPIRRTSAVLQLLHALRHFYWIKKPPKVFFAKPSLASMTIDHQMKRTSMDLNQLAQIRANILLFMKQVFTSKNTASIQNEELTAILNHLQLTPELDNIRDVLYFLLLMMAEQPAMMVPTFDRCRGVYCVFRLMASEDQHIRIQALKLLGFFLQRSKIRRKKATMDPFNLYALIVNRLLTFNTEIDLPTFNALFEILIEKVSVQSIDGHPLMPTVKTKIENAEMLKVIAELLIQSEQTLSILRLKEIFLRQILVLIRENPANRRLILQITVWQDWLVRLAHFFPIGHDEGSQIEARCCALIIHIFSYLLFHALRNELGGWRVWIDTLAIFHAHMSRQLRWQIALRIHSKSEEKEATKENGEEHLDLSSTRRVADVIEDPNGTREKADKFKMTAPQESKTVTQFSWSFLHRILLDNLLSAIEEDLNQVMQIKRKQSVSTEQEVDAFDNDSESDMKRHSDADSNMIIHYLNQPEQEVYAVNLVHLVSQLADTLVSACGVCVCSVRNNLEAKFSDRLPDQLQLSRCNLLEMGLLRAPCDDEKVLALESVDMTANQLDILADRIKNLSKSCLAAQLKSAQSGQQPAEAASEGELRKERSTYSIYQLVESDTPANLRELLFGIVPITNYPMGYLGFTFHLTVLAPLYDPDMLFQHVDINRLHNVIFRDEVQSFAFTLTA